MEGYYDYRPTHHLERPLVLVGFVNHLTRSIACTLASMTGLPLALLDELVEHRMGASAHKAIDRHGLAAWRVLEREELFKALRSTPPAVIAVGEGVLTNPNSLNVVLEKGELVYLYLPEEEACRRASQQSANHSASLWVEVAATGGTHEEGLRALFELRWFTYELAHHTIDVSNRSCLDVANYLRDRLALASG